MLAGRVVTNSLLVVVTNSAQNCWQNRSREDAELPLKANVDVSNVAQVRTLGRQPIV